MCSGVKSKLIWRARISILNLILRAVWTIIPDMSQPCSDEQLHRAIKTVDSLRDLHIMVGTLIMK